MGLPDGYFKDTWSMTQAARAKPQRGQRGALGDGTPAIFDGDRMVALDSPAGRRLTQVARQADAAAYFDPWATYAVPPFPIDCLPPVLRNFVERAARNIGVDPAAMAMTALGASSGAIDHGFALKLKAHGNWYASPRLWVMLVGDASTKKTPTLAACLKPLRGAERELQLAHKRDLARHAERKEAGEKEPAPAPPVRFIANNITVESMGDLLTRQNRGILGEQDELSGWIGQMDKYGGGKGAAADRAFWLQAYNGGPMAVDRIGRGNTYIENCSVSLIGGIQPRRLAELGNLSSDGLLQRFLPVMMGRPTYPEDADDGAAVEAYDRMVAQLLSLNGVRLKLSADAAIVTADLHRFIFDAEEVDGLGDSFRSFLGKLSGVHGSLMLLLHLAADPLEASYDDVSAATAEAAARIVRTFIIPHAMALYRESADAVDWEYLRSLASFVLTSTKDRFTASDFTSGVRAMRGLGSWDVAQKVSPLVAGGWLTEETETVPAKAWSIVPGLRERLAERRATELQRRAEALAAMRAMNVEAP